MFDVVVVGSGPSGSTASYLLSKNGLKVALVEKTKLPREKACGGGINTKNCNVAKRTGIV